ncbi:MAG: glycosyltransferase family 4 protein [Ruminococcus sp.]|nr:glycosyltransferase family 4 protein [Ruminococcus sp.]
MADKKKLLYITRYSLHQEFNLKKKFDGQLNAFRNLGFDVFFIGFDEKYLYLINGNNKTIIGNTHFGFPSYLHTLFYNDLHKAAVKVINSEKVDYVYWRTAPLWNSSCKVAQTIKRNKATFIYEIPTFPQQKEEHLNGLRKLFSIYSDRFTDKFNSMVDYYVLIGEDAGGHYKGKPAINIENGIDVSSVPVRKPKCEETIHILALASMCYWHGYDRLIKSLAEYKGDQKIVIHMVGGNDGGCLNEWKELASKLGLKNTVVFHGQLTGKALEEMFDLCDIGVNSLAMYRKGFAVTMELKAREYIARGLPFVCAVEDPALVDPKEALWLKITNDESVPDMEQIVEFALEMKKNTTHVLSLRKLAENRLTWEMQYKKVFDLIGGNKV